MRRCRRPRRPSSPWRRNTQRGLADGHLVRAVVDVNVLISGVLSAKGSSAEILRASRDGQFELVVSELLLAELKRTLAYPKLRKRITPEKAAAFTNWVRDSWQHRRGSSKPTARRLPRPRRRLPPRTRDRPPRVPDHRRQRPARPERRPADPHTRTVRDQAPRDQLSSRQPRCRCASHAAITVRARPPPKPSPQGDAAPTSAGSSKGSPAGWRG